MKKLIQINSVVNTGSTGRIVEGIGEAFIERNWESHIAYGRFANQSNSQLIKIGNKFDLILHGLHTRIFDRHGLASVKATKGLIKKIEDLKPDVIGLHNIHGYYLNIELLFDFLKKTNKPVVWTLHDCWPFTGHCSYFSYVGCEKWKTHCNNCPLTHSYPKSLFFDNSFQNFEDKQNIFTGHKNLTIVTPSRWLKGLVKQSFLKDYPVQVIHNGIDLTQFRVLAHPINESTSLKKKKLVLGVASIWEERKGLNDFIELYEMLNDDYQIVLIGVTKKEKGLLPNGIIGITRTENKQELTSWYNQADVFLNPTYEDNFPTTNLEALACGTPVVTYDTGGSPEAIDGNTGVVVTKGDIQTLKDATERISFKKPEMTLACRNRAKELFDQNDRFKDYMKLYKSMYYY